MAKEKKRARMVLMPFAPCVQMRDGLSLQAMLFPIASHGAAIYLEQDGNRCHHIQDAKYDF